MVGLYRYAPKSVSLFVWFNKKMIFLTIFKICVVFPGSNAVSCHLLDVRVCLCRFDSIEEDVIFSGFYIKMPV